MTAQELPAILTVPQVAEYLQLKEVTVRRMLARGEIKAAKIGKEWRIRKADVDSYISTQISNQE